MWKTFDEDRRWSELCASTRYNTGGKLMIDTWRWLSLMTLGERLLSYIAQLILRPPMKGSIPQSGTEYVRWWECTKRGGSRSNTFCWLKSVGFRYLYKSCACVGECLGIWDNGGGIGGMGAAMGAAIGPIEPGAGTSSTWTFRFLF